MKKLSALLAAVTACAVLAACGTASGEIEGNTFHVGTIPNPSDVAIYLGNTQGFYADAGLTVEPKIATGFAPNLASVINGESQVGFAAVVPLIVAKSKGAPITIIAGADKAPAEYDPATDPDRVFVAAGSDIDSPKDLEGKTVAVNALGSIQDLGIKIMVERDGGDPGKIKFLTLASNDMAAAIAGGRVDAGALSEPFSTAAGKQGLKPLFSYVTSPTPGAPVGAYFTSEATAENNVELMDAFVAALTQSNEFAQQHPEEVRKELGEYTRIPENLINEINTFEYSSTITDEQIARLSDLLIEYDYITKPVTGEEILR
ncbi:ABC transporter substrate-binding protein [Tomitella gaofuii]|uniref:ABC transporter substrate-binding protein n=1 Tax=Tomitella gaofuii TaxID=2760083 RepID=UPI0015FE5D07|nr:ABC transporter substrate-binding protein [Tomitella gaofuii]